MRHFGFHNAFPNGKLDRAVYAEQPKHMFSEERRRRKVIKLQCSIYGLKDAAKV